MNYHYKDPITRVFSSTKWISSPSLQMQLVLAMILLKNCSLGAKHNHLLTHYAPATCIVCFCVNSARQLSLKVDFLIC